MRLELATFQVSDIRYGQETRYHSGVLEIHKEEIKRLILEDPRICTADIDVAFPGEKTRIVKIRDVVEPRVKISGPGCVFPGVLGPVETVGDGRTHRLSGLTVMASADYKPTIRSGTGAKSAGVVDMWGPGAEVTPFGSTINLVLVFELVDGVTELEAHAAIQQAEFKVARRLAETTRGKTPENMEVFELWKVAPALPSVVYILTCVTHWHLPHSGVAYYGLPIRESLPTLIHPNELLDGALTTNARQGGGNRETTWAWQNNRIIFELNRMHGTELNFLGVIVQRTRFETEFGKRVSAQCTSQMARLLGAQGAILTRMVGSGNNFVDMMLTVEACEKKGIKTVFLTPEWGGKDGNELPLVFYVPEATAIVSTGSFERNITLPVPSKVIGSGKEELVELFAGDQPFSPWGELTFPGSFCLTGGADWFGVMNLTCKTY